MAYGAGEAAGIPEATMKRARAAMGITGGRVWSMPESGLELAGNYDWNRPLNPMKK